MSVIPHKATPLQSAGGGTEWPPSWNTMPHGISVGRYIDPAFQQLEYERLWSRVWQVAARVDMLDHAFVAGRQPAHAVADDEIALLAARMAAHAPAVGRFDDRMAAMGGDDESEVQRLEAAQDQRAIGVMRVVCAVSASASRRSLAGGCE